MEKLEKAKEISEPMYHKIITEASKKYKAVKGVKKEELEAMVGDMKKHWNTISKTVKSVAKPKPKAKSVKKNRKIR